MISERWVVWSEQHGAWWAPVGYTRSLRKAGRYGREEAMDIVARANVPCDPPDFNEVAMPDPTVNGTGPEQV